ncbi:hypothetical protein D3C84_745750 [compost metagenome]
MLAIQAARLSRRTASYSIASKPAPTRETRTPESNARSNLQVRYRDKREKKGLAYARPFIRVSDFSTLRPQSLRKAEHEQQQIMIGLGGHGGLGDSWQGAIFAVRCAENLSTWLLPRSHCERSDCQGSYQKQTSRNFELHCYKPLIALPNALS